jgi:hypothetical protein
MRAINSIPIPPEMAKYKTAVEDAAEVLDKVFWDTQNYAAAGSTLLTFFQALPANIELGNLDQPGIIGGNRPFLIRAISVAFRTQISDDIRILAAQGVLRLSIGNKDYSEWPVHLLPPGGGVCVAFSTGVLAQNVEGATFGVPDVRNCYTLAKPLLIPPQLNFRVTMEYRAAQAISAQTAVTVLLKGEIVRYVQ